MSPHGVRVDKTLLQDLVDVLPPLQGESPHTLRTGRVATHLHRARRHPFSDPLPEGQVSWEQQTMHYSSPAGRVSWEQQPQDLWGPWPRTMTSR